MRIETDYHLHTTRCKHASGTMEAYVEQAIRLGLKEIAFTDHIPMPDDFDIAHRMHRDELDAYVHSIRDLNDTYPEILILTGIEAEYYEGSEYYVQQVLEAYPFDIVIMGTHFLKHWSGDNWVFHYSFPGKPLKDIYSDYLQTLIRGIKTGLFDVVAHLDLIKAPNAPLIDENHEDVTRLLKEVKHRGMAVEINTSGKRRTINEYYPAPEIWDLIRAEKVPVTVGSDAHTPQQVGLCFKELERELRQSPVRFRGRTYHEKPAEVSEIGEK